MVNLVDLNTDQQAIADVAGGDDDTQAVASNGRITSSMQKVLKDQLLFKSPITWTLNVNVTDFLQPYDSPIDGFAYAPAVGKVPFVAATDPSLDATNWSLLVGNGYVNGSGIALDMAGGDIDDVGNLTVGSVLFVTSPSNVLASFKSTDPTADITVGDSTSTVDGNGIRVAGDILSLRTAATTAITIDANQKVTFNDDIELLQVTDPKITLTDSSNTVIVEYRATNFSAIIGTTSAHVFDIQAGGAVAVSIDDTDLSVDFNDDIRVVGDIDAGTFASNGASNGIQIQEAGNIRISQTTTATTPVLEFHNTNNEVGSIEMTASATAYNTSSDPDLKTTFVKIDGDTAWTMIKEAHDQDMIGEFEFLSNPGVTVWGYNAWKLVDNQPGFGGSDRRGPDNARDLPLGSEYEVPVLDENGEPVMEDVIEIKQRQRTFKNPIMETVKKENKEGVLVDVEVSVTEKGDVKVKTHIEMIEGVATLIPEKTIEGDVKVFEELPLFDENGSPIMETYKEVTGQIPKVKIEIIGPAKVDQSKRMALLEAALHHAMLKIEVLENA